MKYNVIIKILTWIILSLMRDGNRPFESQMDSLEKE